VSEPEPREIARAAMLVRDAEAVVIATGAGMGVDSGLPDFRGPEGFWRAYPAYRDLGLRFDELANPRWFTDDPALAWGFYGHRLALYRKTVPHEGFAVLSRIAARMKSGAFVFTSNVDGQHQRAGVPEERVAEVHGAIETFQCTKHASCGLWPAGADVWVDERFRAQEPLPRYPTCGALARPNILMFGDWGFLSDRTDAQLERLQSWLNAQDLARVVVIECGAGTHVPTVRAFSEQMLKKGAALVRINVREPQTPAHPRSTSVAAGAKAALLAIEAAIRP
jgi:NAD-dependent SIR2 family protein deacetylase